MTTTTMPMPMPMPTNSLVTPLLTDLYQITMTYAHWKMNKHTENAAFELFFRKNPFKGEFTIFCGLDECMKHIQNFSFSKGDIEYLKSTPSLSFCEDGYFDYLLNLTTSGLKVRALQEGTVCFPRVPMIILEGPLGLCQLLETTLLNLVNYPSLIATNAARMVERAKPGACFEFGLRRAQGPDGACSASKYSYVGGCLATSNVQAGKVFGIPIIGTHAHAYVQSFLSLEEVESLQLLNTKTDKIEKFLPHVLKYRSEKGHQSATNDGELAAFVAYACAFPTSCLCLIDTYDTLKSGLLNFIAVAKALDDFGYAAKGIRLDSGNLATLSVACQAAFMETYEETKREPFKNMNIVVSNDINEKTLQALSQTEHAIKSYGIGTNLVTCQAQPALGCVYKLVELKNEPRIKISQDFVKITIPGRKRVYRLFGTGTSGTGTDNDNAIPLVDYMTMADNDEVPMAGQSIKCYDPFDAEKQLEIVPTKVITLHELVFSGMTKEEESTTTTTTYTIPTLQQSQTYVKEQLQSFGPELIQYENARKYNVMVSSKVFQYLNELRKKIAM